MPYTRQERREDGDVSEAGDLNYQIHQLIHRHLTETPGYADYNAVIGVLEYAKMELYRRLIAPYEENKIGENGDCEPYIGRGAAIRRTRTVRAMLREQGRGQV